MVKGHTWPQKQKDNRLFLNDSQVEMVEMVAQRVCK